MKGIITIFFTLMTMHFSSSLVSAQTITLSATESATSTPAATIQYDLPYPGILPDHPLYFLKVTRDHFVGFLINDPVKKAEFNLLQADKKLFAASMLMEKEKTQLGIDTLSKSNNYMHNAVSETIKAKKSKLVIDEVVNKLGTSMAKHDEIIESMVSSHPDVKTQMQGELKRLRDIRDFYQKQLPRKSS